MVELGAGRVLEAPGGTGQRPARTREVPGGARRLRGRHRLREVGR